MKKLIFLMVIIANYGLNADDLWKPAQGLTGPSSFKNIAVDSDNNIFVTNGSELFKSTDGGSSWIDIELLNDGFQRTWIQSLFTDKQGNLFLLHNNNISILEKGSNKIRNYYSIIYDEDNVYICDSSVIIKEILPVREEPKYYTIMNKSYDCNYGIIITMTKYIEVEGGSTYLVYHSTDFGKTWEEMKTIPGTEIPIKYVSVINDYLWAVDTDTSNYYSIHYGIYNFKTGILNENIPKDFSIYDKIYYNGTDLYCTSSKTFYHSPDDGLNWEISADTIFDSWIDAICIDTLGNIYAAPRSHKLMKSTDKGKSWEKIYIDIERTIDFKKVKKVNDELFAYDRAYNIFLSKDSGLTWENIPMFNELIYATLYDVNSKDEIVYSDGEKVAYSSDKGENWILTGKGIQNMVYNQMDDIQIFDNGSVICHYSPYSYYAKSALDSFLVIKNYGYQMTALSNVQYFGIYGDFMALFDSSFKKAKTYDFNGYIGKINNYSISTDSTIYISTSNGIYKLRLDREKAEPLAFLNKQVYDVFVDDNNFLYASIENDILYSINDGITWTKINSNISGITDKSFFAFGNGNLIAKSYEVYYAKIENTNFLSTKINVKPGDAWGCYNQSNWSCTFSVKDILNNPVDNAKIFILNTLTSKYDTLLSDMNGIVNYSFTPDYYSPNGEDNFYIYFFSDKDGYYRSSTENIKLTVKSDLKKLRLINKENTFQFFKYGLNDTANYYFKLLNEKDKVTSGKIIIENELTKIIDSIDVSGQDYGNYHFNINEDDKRGMYKLNFWGISESDDTTALYETYFIITDNVDFYIYPSVKDITSFLNFILFPNPTFENATILFSLKEQAVINIKVFNAMGIEVLNLAVNEFFDPGQHNIQLNTEGLPSGLYFCILRAGNNSQIAKFVVTK